MFPCICTDLPILKARGADEKQELKTMLKCGKLYFGVILDRKVFP